MPKTLVEANQDIEDIKKKQTEQEIRDVKVDQVLEALLKQSEKFEKALEQFQSVVVTMNTAITILQGKSDFNWKIIAGCGATLLVILSVIAGHYINLPLP